MCCGTCRSPISGSKIQRPKRPSGRWYVQEYELPVRVCQGYLAVRARAHAGLADCGRTGTTEYSKKRRRLWGCVQIPGTQGSAPLLFVASMTGYTHARLQVLTAPCQGISMVRRLLLPFERSNDAGKRSFSPGPVPVGTQCSERCMSCQLHVSDGLVWRPRVHTPFGEQALTSLLSCDWYRMLIIAVDSADRSDRTLAT
ncbi:hypothetical protein OH76DRAFT_1162002 [Lentinus brumalis]|uniref:Uncharacterized protein n=1 Tax=Lentinus brumalis TaxID=2498619 RepID=A0A371DN02_9APHY|nr:hypothetical protein OH76DRAFT_1162002 [Polyporus brumalis]